MFQKRVDPRIVDKSNQSRSCPVTQICPTYDKLSNTFYVRHQKRWHVVQNAYENSSTHMILHLYQTHECANLRGIWSFVHVYLLLRYAFITPVFFDTKSFYYLYQLGRYLFAIVY